MRCTSTRQVIQKQLPFCHRDFLKLPLDFYKYLFRPIFESAAYPCYLLAITLTGFKKVDSILGINSFFKPALPGQSTDWTPLSSTLESKQSFVKPSTQSQSTMKQKKPSTLQSSSIKKPSTSTLQKISTENPPKSTIQDQDATQSTTLDVKQLLELVDTQTGRPLFFKCGECGDVFDVVEKQEHLDYHFAARLSRSIAPPPSSSTGSIAKTTPKPKIVQGGGVTKKKKTRTK